MDEPHALNVEITRVLATLLCRKKGKCQRQDWLD
jgi:hypothetical protein